MEPNRKWELYFPVSPILLEYCYVGTGPLWPFRNILLLCSINDIVVSTSAFPKYLASKEWWFGWNSGINKAVTLHGVSIHCMREFMEGVRETISPGSGLERGLLASPASMFPPFLLVTQLRDTSQPLPLLDVMWLSSGQWDIAESSCVPVLGLCQNNLQSTILWFLFPVYIDFEAMYERWQSHRMQEARSPSGHLWGSHLPHNGLWSTGKINDCCAVFKVLQLLELILLGLTTVGSAIFKCGTMVVKT